MYTVSIVQTFLLGIVRFLSCLIPFSFKKVTSRQRSGKGAIRKKIPTPKTVVGKTKLTVKYLYYENIS